MSGKYAFSQALKEVRFLFCQTAEHSGPTRSVALLLFHFHIPGQRETRSGLCSIIGVETPRSSPPMEWMQAKKTGYC